MMFFNINNIVELSSTTVNSSLVTMKWLAIFVTLFAFASLIPKIYLIETEDNVEAKEVKFAVISIIKFPLHIKEPTQEIDEEPSNSL